MYNRKEYLKEDPGYLLRKYCNRFLKKEGMIIPDFFQEVSAKSIYDICTHAEIIALSAVYFHNDPAIAEKILRIAFSAINGKRIGNNDCICGYAETLGSMANLLELNSFVSNIRFSISCPSFGITSRLTPLNIQDHYNEATEKDRLKFFSNKDEKVRTKEEIKKEKILQKIFWLKSRAT